jgi:GNAT superfamily N-acetyltransferase
MRIEPLDPADQTAVTEVVELWGAAHEVDYPDFPPFCPPWDRGRITHPIASEPSEFHLAREGSGLVGVLDLGLTMRDNLSSGWMDVVVHPQSRRRGVGTALFEFTRQRLEQLGRKWLMLGARTSGPGAEFARAIGAELGLAEIRRRLVVDAGTKVLADRLLDDARPHASGYSIVRWIGDTPERYLDGIAYLTGRMSTDAPLDDLVWEPEQYDRERIREREAAFAARGRRAYTTVVIHDATGQLAGFTQVSFDSCQATDAWQWDTIVDPEHRGHRLGVVLKVENLRFALEREPELRTVTTWNAGSNAHMIAINEAMGFRAVDEWGEWQLRL